MSSHSFFSTCPRCGTKALEKLITHSHCLECLYFEVYYNDFSTSLVTGMLAEKYLNPKNNFKPKSQQNKKSTEEES